MKQTNINIDEIKRFSTVTYPILADDLHTPQAYAFTLRRAIVTDCNDRQRAELVELLEGKETAEGVTFNNTKVNRERLHRWQNRESRKERAAILGEGWQYIVGLNHGTQPGDLITCIDGTRGRVTKSDPESCVIEFETENGQRLSVGGYFRYTPSEKSESMKRVNSESNTKQGLSIAESCASSTTVKIKIYIVASTNIESTKAFTNKLLAQDYCDELQKSERRDKVTITEQEIDIPFATDRRKYGMTLREIRDEIAAFTGDNKSEAMRKAKIFAHNISIAHVCRIRLSFGKYSRTENGKVIYYGENRDTLHIEWTDQDGYSDTFSIIE